MEKGYTLISPCFFGMEKMLANEIKNLGFEIVKTEDGRVTYKTDEYGIAKANIWLRCAERVHLKIAEFEAKSFDELFEGTKRINWAKYIPYGAQFPITKAFSSQDPPKNNYTYLVYHILRKVNHKSKNPT